LADCGGGVRASMRTAAGDDDGAEDEDEHPRPGNAKPDSLHLHSSRSPGVAGSQLRGWAAAAGRIHTDFRPRSTPNWCDRDFREAAVTRAPTAALNRSEARLQPRGSRT